MALVTFSTEAQILSSLTLINGQASRESLIRKLPTIAGGFTYICKGLRKGLEVRHKYENSFIHSTDLVFD